jgi:hypothetical protein
MGTGGLFLGTKVRPGRDADHSRHLVSRSRMSSSYISSPPCRLHGSSGTILLWINVCVCVCVCVYIYIYIYIYIYMCVCVCVCVCVIKQFSLTKSVITETSDAAFAWIIL